MSLAASVALLLVMACLRRSVRYRDHETAGALIGPWRQPRQMLQAEVLRGTADIVGPPTALDRRLRELKPLADPVSLKT